MSLVRREWVHPAAMDLAGWWAPNSVDVRDIRPTFRKAGGGVTQDMLSDSLRDCVLDCLSNAQARVRDAQDRVAALRALLKETP